MRAFAIDQFGEKGSVRELPTPEPQEGEVLVRVRAAGVNAFDVAVVNRTPARAEALARHFGKGVTPQDFSATARLLPQASLLTNASMLGAMGQPDLDLDLSALDPEAVVCELNYVPLTTALLRAAVRTGHRVADGLGMLMHQAVPGFARWFAATPRVTPQLRALLEADIRAKAGG